jgi:uncharacterized membrane protein
VVGGDRCPVGYLFGHVLELLLEDVQRYEMAIIALLALIGALVWLIRAIRGRHSGRLGR